MLLDNCYSSTVVQLCLSFDDCLYCLDCRIKPKNLGDAKYDYVAYNTGVMLQHLNRHSLMGDIISEDLKRKLISDDYANFPEGGKGGGCFIPEKL